MLLFFLPNSNKAFAILIKNTANFVEFYAYQKHVYVKHPIFLFYRLDIESVSEELVSFNVSFTLKFNF